MRYGKDRQLTNKRVKPKQKKEGQISKEVYAFVLRRDNNRCVTCGSVQSLECHHIKPRSRGGVGQPHNLCMLCKDCHLNKIHGKGDYITKIKVFNYMIFKGYDFRTEKASLTFKHNQLNIGRRTN